VVNKNFIICLTGLPASGKSTFAKKLSIIIKEKFNTTKVKIVDPDTIRQLLTPTKFNHKIESEVRKQNLTQIREHLLKGNIVISDDLNYYTSMRHELKEIADELNILFFIIHISTPLKTCLKWNKARGKPIPDKVIRNIQKKFDNFDKYTWDQPKIKYDMSQIQNIEDKIEDLVEQLLGMVHSHETITEGVFSTVSNEQNENLDQITRGYIGGLLQNSNLLHMKKNILKARKLFIKTYKNQNLKDSEIPGTFKRFLEKRLNILISQDFF
jgi:tRNA uridine 5-carbamoylmethylation protein Kti12